MRFFVLMVILGLNGCATSSYCTEELDYQQAKSVAPLKNVEGLNVPESPAALRIPPAPQAPVAFGEIYKDEAGNERAGCLDTPPTLTLPPPVAQPPAPEEKAKS